MKHVYKRLFIIFCFYCVNAFANDYDSPEQRTKFYFNISDLEISQNILYIHLGDNLIETQTLRTDQQGIYIFEDDIANYGVAKERKWKCPYCNHWWLIGEKCKNPDCPTNNW